MLCGKEAITLCLSLSILRFTLEFDINKSTFTFENQRGKKREKKSSTKEFSFSLQEYFNKKKLKVIDPTL